RRDHQLLDRRSRGAGGQADRVPARASTRGGGAEHGVDELRQVLAPAQGLRVQDGVRQPLRRDHRVPVGDARLRHQARARVLRPGSCRVAAAAGPPDPGVAGERRVTAPLEGVRVLDLSRLLPGGFCSLLLADFGADVVKVEDTGMGDYVRWAPPGYEGAEDSARSALFLALNRNKRSIRIDLKTEGGRDVLLRLARDADVLLESFRPGVLDRLGVGHDVLREANPALVICAITGYGQDGPLRDRSGHDMNYLGLVGLLGLTGEAGGPPVQAAGQIADIGGGALLGACGIMAALRHRDATGEGQVVDVSRADGAPSWLAMGAARHPADGAVPPPGGLH